MYYIYILYSETLKKYYIGQSNDPWKRLEQHNENPRDKFTGKAQDWELKATFEVSENRAEAVRFERFIKNQKSRKFIDKLIDPSTELVGELTQLVRVPHMRD